jgi:amino acid transporter
MNHPVALKRSLSLLHMTLYGLGTILGAGIYVLVGQVAAGAGMYAPVSFLVAALLATLTGLSYAELSARYPRSAGEAVYVQEGLGRRTLAVSVGWLIIFTGIVSAAAIANGFVGYLHVFVALSDWLVIVALVLALGALAAWGISESVTAAAIITLVEIGGLLLILVVTGDSLLTLPQRWPELIPPPDISLWHGILLGAFLAFYAFIGFEDMVNVAEEVKEPTRTLPRAILLAIGISTLLYLLVALAAVLVLPLSELSESRAPLALMYERATGAPPTLISLISLFAVVNGALIQIIMSSRVLYGMSRQGWLHVVFSRVHPVTRTPLMATALVTGLVLILALWLPIVTLAKATSLIVLVVFTLVNLALVRIKRRAPKTKRGPCFPLWVPLAGFLANGVFVLYQILDFWRGG